MPIKKDEIKMITDIDEAEEGKINIMMAKNGYFQVIKNKVMYIIRRINNNPLLDKEIEEGIIMRESLKIPAKLVLTALVFLKKVKKKYDTEAVVIITKKDNKYLLELPEQVASMAHVQYSTKNLEGIPVMIIHSHPGESVQETSFSGTDDKDDKFSIFNAVTSIFMTTRIRCGDKFVSVDDAFLFDIDNDWIDEKLNEFSKYVKKYSMFDDEIDGYKYKDLWKRFK